MPLPDPPLLLITDRRQAARPLAEVVTAALAAGCRWVSVREKDLPTGEQVRLIRALVPAARHHAATLMLHGDARAAQLAGADGVHLPAGADAAGARALMGPNKLVGVSVHAANEAEALDPSLADYVLAGPAFETASKPGYGPEIGRAGLAGMARTTRVPVLAIGGINPARVADLITAGAAGIAVMGGVMRAADPMQEVRGLLAALADALASPARDKC